MKGPKYGISRQVRGAKDEWHQMWLVWDAANVPALVDVQDEEQAFLWTAEQLMTNDGGAAFVIHEKTGRRLGTVNKDGKYVQDRPSVLRAAVAIGASLAFVLGIVANFTQAFGTTIQVAFRFLFH